MGWERPSKARRKALIDFVVRADIKQEDNLCLGLLIIFDYKYDSAIIAARACPQPHQLPAELVGTQEGSEQVFLHS